jgi:hypothetical protein
MHNYRNFLCIVVIALAAIMCPLASAVTINVTYGDAAGEGFNDPVLGASRTAAFEYALNIWAGLLSGPVTVEVTAEFNNLGGSPSSAVLGSAGPVSYSRDFSGAPIAGTWYSRALSDQLHGSDLAPGSFDIRARFNSDLDGDVVLGTKHFYYGTDQSPGTDSDFVSVALHELCHGLNFTTLVDATGTWALGYPDVYGRLLKQTGTVNLMLTDMADDAARAAALIDSGSLVFTGASTVAAYGSQPLMYAPNPYQGGSSVSHWDTSHFPNELMEPSYTGANHDPALALQLFEDLGWTLAASTPTPTPTPGGSTPTPTGKADLVLTGITLPSLTVTEGGAFWYRATVQNSGTLTAPSSHAKLYLSIDNDFDTSDDYEVTPEQAVALIAPSGNDEPQWNFTFPNLADTATYPVWALFLLDSQGEVDELSESNLYKSSSSITVTNSAAAPTPTNTGTPTNTATNTPVPPTPTNTPVDTSTPTPTATDTPVDTSTPTPTFTPMPTATYTPITLALDGVLDGDATIVSSTGRYKILSKLDSTSIYVALVDTAPAKPGLAGNVYAPTETIYLVVARQGVEGRFVGAEDPLTNPSNYVYLNGSSIISVNPQDVGSTGGGYLKYNSTDSPSTSIFGLSNVLVGSSTDVIEMTVPLAENGLNTSTFFVWGVVIENAAPGIIDGSAPPQVSSDSTVNRVDEISLIDSSVNVKTWRQLSIYRRE